MRKLTKRIALAFILLLLSAAATVQVYTLAMDRSLANGHGTLRLVVASLQSSIERYQALPGLVADRSELLDVLARPGDRATRLAANRYLADLARRLAISDAYVMLPSGETVAASNYEGISFVGENFRYRPYFQAAAEGGQGRFFGLGTTSDRRGFYFSDPIRAGGQIVGIVAFKIDLDPIEASWASSDTEILVIDPENIVFMAGRPDWRYRVFGDPDNDALRRSTAIRRYAERPVGTLDVRPSHSFDRSPTIVVGSGAGSREFQRLDEAMPQAGWTVVVLADTAPALRQALTAGLAVLLLLSLGVFLLRAARSKHRRTIERERAEGLVKERLEREVAQRTNALALANDRLEGEIAERRAAENQLRKMQADLVEAGKLAALGQMSAALSHEFNQPLAAASAYADNAALLVERDKKSDALETIGRVAKLLERLSTISRTLRNFARRPEEELVTVDVAEAVDEALGIVGHRITAVDARVVMSPELRGLEVEAVAIRLQQVFVNLLTNAADAVEGRAERRILIGRRDLANESVAIFVEDTGAGVPSAVAPRIFDPFFTSKAVGKGLGLGLSISYNIIGDFGGRLRLETAATGGARFVIELPRTVSSMQSAAE